MKPEKMIIDHLFGCSEYECRKFFDTNEPKYDIGEIVEACSWTKTITTKILDVRVTYHPRMEEYVWGYLLEENPGLTMNYIPEGYLRKINKQ